MEVKANDTAIIFERDGEPEAMFGVYSPQQEEALMSEFEAIKKLAWKWGGEDATLLPAKLLGA